jgi:hypothetical protein
MLILSCEPCGRSFGADTATVSREPRCVVYRCPRDGAELVTVSRGKFRRGGGNISLHYGSVVIRAGGEDIELDDFMREINGVGKLAGTIDVLSD